MEQHTRPNASNAWPGLVGVSFLLSFALFTYVVRMYTRMHPVFRLAASDYLVTAGVICEVITLALLLATIRLGVSGYDEYITPPARVKIGKLFFALGFVAFWASSLARVSIGSMLLCFPISRAWKVVLWILLVVQVIMPIGANIFALLQCHPIRAMWEPLPTAVCWSDKVSQIYGYIYAGFGTLSDIIFASMPVHLFWSLNRPVLERVLGIMLMGFGIVAAVASAMKIYHISAWNPREAQFRDWIPLLWWYRVEELGLIVAACAPFLKPLMEHALVGLGASRFKFRTLTLSTVQEQNGQRKDTLLRTESITEPQMDGDTLFESNVVEPRVRSHEHSDAA